MPTTPTAPTAVPDFPELSDRATYNARAYAWAVHMDTVYPAEMLALASNTYANAVEGAASADTAVTAAAAAEGSATLAGAVAWVSGTTYALGDAVYSLINLQTYRRSVAGGGTVDPSIDTANWTLANDVPTGIVSNDITPTDWNLTTSTSVGTSTTYTATAVLDADRTLFLFSGSTSVHAAVYNATTDTWGSPVLIRTANIASNFALAVIATDKILLSTTPQSSTALETVVLTVSALVITVGTALATTLAAAGRLSAGVGFVTVGSSYIITYDNAGGICCHRAITVSGTTPSIGSELVLTGYSTSAVSYSATSSVFLTVSTTNLVLYALPITVSGTTLTAGTQATATVSSGNFRTQLQPLSTGRWVAMYVNSTWRAAIVNVSGTTATLSAADTAQSYSAGTDFSVKVFSGQATIKKNTSGYTNVVTDNSGTIALGTAITTPQTGPMFSYVGTSVLIGSTSDSRVQKVGISGNNPVLEADFQSTAETAYTAEIFTAFDLGYGALAVTTLRTSTGKTAALGPNNRSYCLVTTGDSFTTRCHNPGYAGTPIHFGDDTVFCVSAGSGNVLNIRRLVLA